MKIPESYLDMAVQCFRGRSWDVGEQMDHGGSIGTYLQRPESGCGEEESILHLPDDIWLSILSYLSIQDVVRYAGEYAASTEYALHRCEASCSMLRGLIVYYGVYKSILDRICRRKRINNYMLLPVGLSRTRTELEISAYYKRRLYLYTNK